MNVVQLASGAGSEPPERGGRRRAFGEAVAAHYRMLYAYAHALTRDHAAAEDLLHDTVVRAMRGLRHFNEGTNLAAWLRRIMRNLFTDTCRVRHRTVSLGDQDVADRLADETATADPPRPTARDFVSMADVHGALESVDAPLRQVFELAHLENWSYQMIARKLDIPISTVGTRLWRARARLRLVLESGGSSPAPEVAWRPSAHHGVAVAKYRESHDDRESGKVLAFVHDSRSSAPGSAAAGLAVRGAR